LTILNIKKSISIGLILFFGFFLTSSNPTTTEIINSENILSENLEDEIYPLCEGMSFDELNNLTNKDLNNIKIDLVDKDKWFENFFLLQKDRNDIIPDKYKKKFSASIKFEFKNFSCTYYAKVSLTGDVQDHIRNMNQTSLNVSLLEGSIFGISEFKLFLPETRYGVNELFVTSILERYDVLTPRTFQTNVVFNRGKVTKYFFQEKLVKEFVEFNNYREGPLLQVTEDFFWEKRNQKDTDSLFMFAEITNSSWSRKSYVNQHISLKALENYNSLIFNSSNVNNIKVQGMRLTYDTSLSEYKSIAKFDTLMAALDAQHGLAFTNRNFYYDNFKNELIPIYYDGDSQLTDRTLFRNAPLDLCKNFSDTNYYFRYLCINSYHNFAKKLLDELSFNANDLYQDVTNKGGVTDIQTSKTVFENFKINLNYLSKEKIKLSPRNSSFSKNKTLFPNTSDYGTNFIFFDFLNQQGEICNQYLTNCSSLLENQNYFKKNSDKTHPNTYPFGLSLESFTDGAVKSSEVKRTGFQAYGAPKINIDYDNLIFNIILDNNSQKIIITDASLYANWRFVISASPEIEMLQDRMDEKSLTGCITFYNTYVKNISIKMENSFCEDGVNLIRVNGTIEEISIDNSSSDALDIDFSDLEIETIKITNANNDCLDVSGSNISFMYIETNNCGDKGFSVGENSKLDVQNYNSSKSNIGIAIKDSSYVVIRSVDISESQTCVSIYRKKQEFGPAKLATNNYNCQNKDSDFVQLGSEFITIEK